MKKLFYLPIIALALSACTAKIDGGPATPFPDAPPAQKPNTNPTAPIALITSTSKNPVLNELTLATNKTDYMVLFELNNTLDSQTLSLGQVSEEFSGCYPSEVSTALYWGSKNAAGDIVNPTPIDTNSKLMVVAGKSYALLVSFKGIEKCNSYTYKFALLTE